MQSNYFLYFTDQIKETQLIYISTNKGTNDTVHFTINEKIFLIVTVQILDVNNIYFASSFLIYVYRNGRYFSSYSFTNNAYWNISISSGNYFEGGLYEIFLISRYSQNFIRECLPYYNLIRSSKFYIYDIILDKQYVQLNYYGKAILDYMPMELSKI